MAATQGFRIEPMVSILEAAADLGWTHSTAYRRARDGTLPTIPISKTQRRVPVRVIAKIKAEQEKLKP
jgi:hypothetical protein